MFLREIYVRLLKLCAIATLLLVNAIAWWKGRRDVNAKLSATRLDIQCRKCGREADRGKRGEAATAITERLEKLGQSLSKADIVQASVNYSSSIEVQRSRSRGQADRALHRANSAFASDGLINAGPRGFSRPLNRWPIARRDSSRDFNQNTAQGRVCWRATLSSAVGSRASTLPAKTCVVISGAEKSSVDRLAA